MNILEMPAGRCSYPEPTIFDCCGRQEKRTYGRKIRHPLGTFPLFSLSETESDAGSVPPRRATRPPAGSVVARARRTAPHRPCLAIREPQPLNHQRNDEERHDRHRACSDGLRHCRGWDIENGDLEQRRKKCLIGQILVDCTHTCT